MSTRDTVCVLYVVAAVTSVAVGVTAWLGWWPVAAALSAAPGIILAVVVVTRLTAAGRRVGEEGQWPPPLERT